MNIKAKLLSIASSAAIAVTAIAGAALSVDPVEAATKDASASYEWGTLRIGGGGFVSGIVAGKDVMYARTDVGGAYRYNYKTESWEQLFGFISEDDRGLLSVDAMAIDPNDDKTVYFLCGCAYFSNEKTVIYKTTDGGDTFKEIDVTNLIKVMGNGDGRQFGESIAVDPKNPKIIYAGGDVTSDLNSKSALIKSTDGGETWAPVIGYDDLGLFSAKTKWPTWSDIEARSVTADAYNNQNGVGAIAIQDDKVYVATSVSGKANVHVANVADDKFSVLSKDLPTDAFPSRINKDANGNLLISYMAGLAFLGGTGGAYRYDTKTGTVTNIIDSATGGFGSVWADPKNPDHLIAGTCGKWASQLWTEWTEEHGPAWGDQYFRSFDGGKTWQNFTPGQNKGWNQPLVSNYLQDGGYSWIRDKAIHWSGTVVTDPRDSNRMFITSGNGVFIATDIWSQDDDKLPTFTFHPDGIEEVVSLDFYSTADGLDLSAIGDYDGFVHNNVDEIPPQYQPNMGSTSAITVCPADTNVWARTANGDGNNTGSGYYTLDRGKTWTAFKPACTGGKLAITKLSEGKYRIFNTSAGGAASYSDDFGGSWKECSGIKASKGVYMMVDPEDPKTVYASGALHNDYWSSDMSKKEPTYDESHYSYYISEDYGATWKETRICPYNWELSWKFENTGDLAYVSKGTVALAGANHGVYLISDKGATVEQLKTVKYAKCIGYGAPKTKGDVNVLYIYGRPEEDDPEGIYASEDAGKTWYCINTNHLYGGTGNGNYIVGDLDEYGKIYMSTVGCGIVYGQLLGTEPKPQNPTKPQVTTQATTAATTSSTTTSTTVITSVSTDTVSTAAPSESSTSKVTNLTPGPTLPSETTAPTTSSTSAASTAPTEKPTSADTSDFLYGDVDINGTVELADITKLSKHLLSSASYPLGNDAGDEASKKKAFTQADVVGDGVLNTLDLSKLIEYNLGNITAQELAPSK